MHGFFILGGLMHATVLAVIAFFVLFAASRSTGLLKTIGNVLGAWLFIAAAGGLVCAVVFGFSGASHPGYGMMGYNMMGYRNAPSAQLNQPAPPAAPVSK